MILQGTWKWVGRMDISPPNKQRYTNIDINNGTKKV